MLNLPLTEYPSCVMFLLQDLDTQHVYRHHDFSIAQLIRPDVAYGMAGKVNGADNFCLVIGPVRTDTNHSRSSTVPVSEGAGGLPIT